MAHALGTRPAPNPGLRCRRRLSRRSSARSPWPIQPTRIHPMFLSSLEHRWVKLFENTKFRATWRKRKSFRPFGGCIEMDFCQRTSTLWDLHARNWRLSSCASRSRRTVRYIKKKKAKNFGRSNFIKSKKFARWKYKCKHFRFDLKMKPHSRSSFNDWNISR